MWFLYIEWAMDVVGWAVYRMRRDDEYNMELQNELISFRFQTVEWNVCSLLQLEIEKRLKNNTIINHKGIWYWLAEEKLA